MMTKTLSPLPIPSPRRTLVNFRVSRPSSAKLTSRVLSSGAPVVSAMNRNAVRLDSGPSACRSTAA